MDEKRNVTENPELLRQLILHNLEVGNYNKLDLGLKSQDPEQEDQEQEQEQ
jgi:hypothetical protein